MAMELEREAKSIAQSLLRWYGGDSQNENFTWIAHGTPVVQTAFSEAVLPVVDQTVLTQKGPVAFSQLEEPMHWILMTQKEKRERVVDMGLTTIQVDAINGVAAAMVGGTASSASSLLAQPGVSDYTANIVALLHGGEGVPLSPAIERIGRRQAYNGATWLASIVSAAIREHSVCGRPPAYELIYALQRLASTLCTEKEMLCQECPIRRTCEEGQFHYDLRSKIKEPPTPRYSKATIDVQTTNLDCCSWQHQPLGVEFGIRDGVVTKSSLKDLIMQGPWKEDALGNLDLNGATATELAQEIIKNVKHVCWCRIWRWGFSTTAWSKNVA